MLRSIVSLLFANATTLIGFGLLAFSSVPVLHDIGLTVGVGAFLALVFSAILGRRDEEETGQGQAAGDRNAALS